MNPSSRKNPIDIEGHLLRRYLAPKNIPNTECGCLGERNLFSNEIQLRVVWDPFLMRQGWAGRFKKLLEQWSKPWWETFHPKNQRLDPPTKRGWNLCFFSFPKFWEFPNQTHTRLNTTFVQDNGPPLGRGSFGPLQSTRGAEGVESGEVEKEGFISKYDTHFDDKIFQRVRFNQQLEDCWYRIIQPYTIQVYLDVLLVLRITGL